MFFFYLNWQDFYITLNQTLKIWSPQFCPLSIVVSDDFRIIFCFSSKKMRFIYMEKKLRTTWKKISINGLEKRKKIKNLPISNEMNHYNESLNFHSFSTKKIPWHMKDVQEMEWIIIIIIIIKIQSIFYDLCIFKQPINQREKTSSSISNIFFVDLENKSSILWLTINEKKIFNHYHHQHIHYVFICVTDRTIIHVVFDWQTKKKQNWQCISWTGKHKSGLF